MDELSVKSVVKSTVEATLKPKPSKFCLHDRVIVITGGGGLMGRQHGLAIAELGALPVVMDINLQSAQKVADEIVELFGVKAFACQADITNKESVKESLVQVLEHRGRVDGLINNAANNEKMEAGSKSSASRFEDFTCEQWDKEFSVGVTGAFLCSQVFGGYMANQRKGVIVNISSDLGIIAPDQRIYEVEGVPPEEQVCKPVSYSVVKHAVIGLTKYLATYWAQSGVRVNALCPGGIFSGQPDELVSKLTHLIPMGRMATEEEYRGAIQFLCADASAYMTGTNMVMDGGRTVW